MASEIIPGKLFVAGFSEAQEESFYQEKGIVRVLNLSGNARGFFPESCEYMYVPIPDEIPDEVFPQIEAAIDFIVKDAQPVMVYCVGGVGRAPTIVIAIFMRELNIGLRTALYKVHEAREIVRPPESFLKHLMRYEQKQIAEGNLELPADEKPFTETDIKIFHVRRDVKVKHGQWLDEAAALQLLEANGMDAGSAVGAFVVE